jgi:hypothetical protein
MHDLTIRKTTLPWDSGETPFFKHYIATCAGFKEGFRMCNSHSGVLLRVELVLSSSTGDGPQARILRSSYGFWARRASIGR